MTCFPTSFSSSGVTSIKAVQNGAGKHVIICKSGSVYDICRSGGVTSIVNLTPASTNFTTATIGTNGGYYALAYDHTSRKILRATLGTSAPSAGSLAHLNATATTMPSGVTLTGIGLHGDYITLIGTDGKIFSSTTTVTASSSANL